MALALGGGEAVYKGDLRNHVARSGGVLFRGGRGQLAQVSKRHTHTSTVDMRRLTSQKAVICSNARRRHSAPVVGAVRFTDVKQVSPPLIALAIVALLVGRAAVVFGVGWVAGGCGGGGGKALRR